MFGIQLSLRCCDAYLRNTSRVSTKRAVRAVPRKSIAASSRPRVLIIESRDDVYSRLRPVLEEADFEIERRDVGAMVTSTIECFEPDLILVSEDMPDESGWLIVCKLRQSRHHQPVWMYAARRPHLQADWKDVYGVDQVIEYGGMLVCLVQQIRQRIRTWLSLPRGETHRRQFFAPPMSPARRTA